MRTLAIMAFASFLILWGVHLLLKDNAQLSSAPGETVVDAVDSLPTQDEPQTMLRKEKRRELDKIGSVINETNVDLDLGTKEQIKVAKKVFDEKAALKEKQLLLEQSFTDRNSTVKDIKKLQSGIVELKNKMRLELTNTERWDPKFVYYLLMQENYTYSEVNMIKSLSENGFNPEELNFITELIKEDSFMERIEAFKGNGGDSARAIASLKKKPKEKDDFIEDPNEDGSTLESKLIEMNYNQEEKEEMVYGINQQKYN